MNRKKLKERGIAWVDDGGIVRIFLGHKLRDKPEPHWTKLIRVEIVETGPYEHSTEKP